MNKIDLTCPNCGTGFVVPVVVETLTVASDFEVAGPDGVPVARSVLVTASFADSSAAHTCPAAPVVS